MAHLALQTCFRNLKDPRRAPRHVLLDIIGIAICAVISGANDWQQIATFAQQRHSWLRRFFKLPEGIPCHDTFERVFDAIDPRAFAQAFSRWMQALAEAGGLRQIAIDGKTLRRSGSPNARPGPPAPGQCLGDREPPRAGSGHGGRQVQRDHGHSGVA